MSKLVHGIQIPPGPILRVPHCSIDGARLIAAQPRRNGERTSRAVDASARAAVSGRSGDMQLPGPGRHWRRYRAGQLHRYPDQRSQPPEVWRWALGYSGSWCLGMLEALALGHVTGRCWRSSMPGGIELYMQRFAAGAERGPALVDIDQVRRVGDAGLDLHWQSRRRNLPDMRDRCITRPKARFYPASGRGADRGERRWSGRSQNRACAATPLYVRPADAAPAQKTPHRFCWIDHARAHMAEPFTFDAFTPVSAAWSDTGIRIASVRKPACLRHRG